MTTITTNQVIIERVFDAPVEILWKIWTDPDMIMRWHGGDPNGEGISAQVDLRVGGRQEVRFRDSKGPDHMFFGEFTIVNPNSRLAYTFEWESEPGHVTLVDVIFIALGEKTKTIITHSNLSPTSEHIYEMGWNGALNKVNRLITITSDYRQEPFAK